MAGTKDIPLAILSALTAEMAGQVDAVRWYELDAESAISEHVIGLRDEQGASVVLAVEADEVRTRDAAGWPMQRAMLASVTVLLRRTQDDAADAARLYDLLDRAEAVFSPYTSPYTFPARPTVTGRSISLYSPDWVGRGATLEILYSLE